MNNVITNANGVKVKVRVKIVVGWYIILCLHAAKIHFIHKE